MTILYYDDINVHDVSTVFWHPAWIATSYWMVPGTFDETE